MIKKMMVAVMAALLVAVLGVSPGAAHDWTPEDGGSGVTAKMGCDGFNHPGSWDVPDGEVCFIHRWYKHDGHLHPDHIQTVMDANVSGGSPDAQLDSVTNIRLRIWSGTCDGAYPNCGGLGELRYDGSMPGVSWQNPTDTKNLGFRIPTQRAFALVQYDYKFHLQNGQTQTSSEQEGTNYGAAG